MTKFADAAWRGMHDSMWMARMEARLLHEKMFERDMTITSGRRPPTPGGSSLHGKGRAMDIRVREPDGTWAMTTEQQRTYAERLAAILGEDFDVVVEGPAAVNPAYKARIPHIHVEYDPKGRHAQEE